MRKITFVIFIVVFSLSFFKTYPEFTYPADNPDSTVTKNVGVKNLPESETMTADRIKKFVESYITKEMELKGDYFLVVDKLENKVLQLNLPQIHDRVNSVVKDEAFCGKYRTRNFWMASCNFKNVNESTYDLDFWVNKNENGELDVFTIAIHKVNGKERFSYNKEEITLLK